MRRYTLNTPIRRLPRSFQLSGGKCFTLQFGPCFAVEYRPDPSHFGSSPRRLYAARLWGVVYNKSGGNCAQIFVHPFKGYTDPFSLLAFWAVTFFITLLIPGPRIGEQFSSSVFYTAVIAGMSYLISRSDRGIGVTLSDLEKRVIELFGG